MRRIDGSRRARIPPWTAAPRRGRGAQGLREVYGRITIVQDDRIRVEEDEGGRGYLFVVRKRAASLDELEQWRDGRVRVRVRYVGEPDAGAIAEEVQVVE
ncbi:MAG: hypothetical protein DIU52_007915 [bacterium]|nr:MAG: hypothetical protein DIU52_15180 [bacterium]